MSIKLIAPAMDGTLLIGAKTYHRQRFLARYRRMRDREAPFA